MMKSYTLHSSEADDVSVALADIQEQMKSVSLFKNAVGILACHYDFVNNGIVEALLPALPFPVVGITTFYQDTGAASGLFELTITVLTSDDVRFAVGYDNACSGTPEERVRTAYQRAFSQHQAAPAAMFSFLSVNRPISGDEYLRLLDKASGGGPNFGAVTTGDDDSGENMYLVCDGEVYTDGFALLLLIGPVSASYYVGNFSEHTFLSMTATVSESDGPVIKQLNGQPATTFLKKNGVVFDDYEIDQNFVSTIPFLIRPPGDESLIARALFRFTSQGELEFMGEVPEGSLLRIGTVSAQDILDVSQAVTEVAVSENRDAVLLMMFSCVGRFITLGLESTAEMEHVKRIIPDDMCYLSCYAAGEVCPVSIQGKYENRYHNSSFVVCALR